MIPSSQRLGWDKAFHNNCDALSNQKTAAEDEQQRPWLRESLLSHRCFLKLPLCETSMPSCAVTVAGYLSVNGESLPAIPTKLLGRIGLKLTNSFMWSGDILEAQLDFLFFFRQALDHDSSAFHRLRFHFYAACYWRRKPNSKPSHLKGYCILTNIDEQVQVMISWLAFWTVFISNAWLSICENEGKNRRQVFLCAAHESWPCFSLVNAEVLLRLGKKRILLDLRSKSPAKRSWVR